MAVNALILKCDLGRYRPKNQEEALVGIITRLGTYMANPFAFLVVFGYGALWYLYKPETFEWHAGATMATWFPLNRTGRTMAASTLGTRPPPQTAPIENDATTDALVAELRAVMATQRLLPPATAAELDAPASEECVSAIETRRDWLARGFRFW